MLSVPPWQYSVLSQLHLYCLLYILNPSGSFIRLIRSRHQNLQARGNHVDRRRSHYPSRHQKKQREQDSEKEFRIPRYNVVLLDDDDHTYEYVIEMLRKLFGHSHETAFQMACEVDNAGRVIVDTTSKERAELKRDQIHAYGADWRIPRCKGSMSAIIEPAEDV